MQAVDDAGVANSNYAWSFTDPATVGFSPNGSNAAANSTATFSQATKLIHNLHRHPSPTQAAPNAASTFTVVVNQTLSSVAVSPNPLTVAGGTTTPFSPPQSVSINSLNPLVAHATFTLNATGGTVDSSGNFTASQTGGACNITATAGAIAGSTIVNIVPTIYSAAGTYNVSVSQWRRADRDRLGPNVFDHRQFTPVTGFHSRHVQSDS